MRRLARPDPLILLAGGIVIVCGALGLFTKLELTPDEVARFEAGIIMVVSAIRMWVGRRAPPVPTFAPSEVETERGTDAG